MVQLVGKVLAIQQENPSSIPSTHVNPGLAACSCNPRAGGPMQEDPWILRLTSLAEAVGFRISERPCLE